jgi:hypothetical protein
MRTLTEDLGRLVYKVETEPLPTANLRRGGAHAGIRRTPQTNVSDSFEQNTMLVQRARLLSSDDDTDSPEQTTPLQQISNRMSQIEYQRMNRQRTSSEDSITQSTGLSAISRV